MSDKSHVSMGYYLCPYSGKEHSEVVLLDKQLENSLERKTFLGYKLDPELDSNYIYLVGTDSDPNTNKQAKLTGTNIALKKEFAEHLGLDINQPLGFTESVFIEKIIEFFHSNVEE